MNKGGFSWKRLVGITRVKSKVSRATGIPLTRSGRQRKIGKAITGGGCMVSIIMLMVSAILLLFAISSVSASPDMAQIVGRYGKPDKDYSSVNERPRPQIVTRYIVYKKENVRFWFIPEKQHNILSSYEGWKLFGIGDEKTKKPITVDEMEKRMQKRVRK